MGWLKEILEESFLLKEDVSNDSIQSAIKNMHPVRITYSGPSESGKGQRIIYPVAYGISTAGNPVVRAFQPQGSTSTETPAWKLFRLDRVKNWRNINSRTFNPQDLSGFNEGGDEQIETLYAISPIGNANDAVKPDNNVVRGKEPEKIVTPHPITKGEVDNGGADRDTEKQYYTTNDIVNDVLKTSEPKMSQQTNKNIDKVAGQNYTSTETKPVSDPHPITKGEIGGQESGQESTPNPPEVDDEPIMKADMEKPQQDSLATAYSDMMGRMDGLNKEDKTEKF